MVLPFRGLITAECVEGRLGCELRHHLAEVLAQLRLPYERIEFLDGEHEVGVTAARLFGQQVVNELAEEDPVHRLVPAERDDQRDPIPGCQALPLPDTPLNAVDVLETLN